MNVIFIGGIYPPDKEAEIRLNSKGGIDNASNNLQWALLAGLDYFYPNVKVITLPNIGTYPLKFKKIHFKGSIFSHKKDAIDFCLSFLNISLIKHISKTINLYKTLKKVINCNEENTIIIYGVHSPFLEAAVQIKNRNNKVKICQIVPDLPQFMSENRNPFYLFLKKMDAILINKNLKKIDSFVLLSDYMAESIKVGNRPWTRVEGIFQQSDNIEYELKEEYKTILYTGSLAGRYGVTNLLDAFESIKDSNYRLWICGEGGSRSEIEKREKSDARIKYFGQLPYNQVLTLQKKATVLVNPRTSEGDFTKYSFPSKTMEYLASGTPCIIYRLQGIPEEYYQYCFVAEDESSEGLRKVILQVCEKGQSELDEFGKKASRFILENKNPISQVRKIYELLNS